MMDLDRAARDYATINSPIMHGETRWAPHLSTVNTFLLCKAYVIIIKGAALYVFCWLWCGRVTGQQRVVVVECVYSYSCTIPHCTCLAHVVDIARQCQNSKLTKNRNQYSDRLSIEEWEIIESCPKIKNQKTGEIHKNDWDQKQHTVYTTLV